MSVFDLKRTKTEPTIPDWIVNENEHRVYDAVNERITEIESLINCSTKPLSATEKKIAKSVICKGLSLSASYIAKHSKLNGYVNGHQRRLNRLSEALKTTEQQSKSNQARPESMNKPLLVKEVKSLRKRLSERESDLYVEQLKHLLDSGLAESQIVVKNRIDQLESELESARIHMVKMKSALSLLKREVTAAHRINKTMSDSSLAMLDSENDPENIVILLGSKS